MTENTDFIATELLKELKDGNARKDEQISRLTRTLLITVAIFVTAILSVVGGFLWYLNQYDFVSTSTITNTANGVYSLIDSEGNVIASDLTPEDIKRIVEGV